MQSTYFAPLPTMQSRDGGGGIITAPTANSPTETRTDDSAGYNRRSFNYDVPDTGLYIHARRHEREAVEWAFNHWYLTGQTDKTRSQWLHNEWWDTGIFWNFNVVIFHRWTVEQQPNELWIIDDKGTKFWYDGMTLYRIDGEPFPGLKTEGHEFIELDPYGREVIEPYEYLPPDLMKQHKEMHAFMQTHYGKSPKQWAEYQRRREEYKQQRQGRRNNNVR